MLKGITILNSYDVITPEWYGTLFPAIAFSFVVISGNDPDNCVAYVIHDSFIPYPCQNEPNHHGRG